ncbi:hypothetical protein F5883DRAFT_368163, partial [Diaporthe sp. PMI_573]
DTPMEKITKSDLDDEREVPRIKAFSVSKDWDAEYYEASARTGTNVDEAFIGLCRQMLRGDDVIEAMNQETCETRYKYFEHGKKKRRPQKENEKHKCIIL